MIWKSCWHSCGMSSSAVLFHTRVCRHSNQPQPEGAERLFDPTAAWRTAGCRCCSFIFLFKLKSSQPASQSEMQLVVPVFHRTYNTRSTVLTLTWLRTDGRPQKIPGCCLSPNPCCLFFLPPQAFWSAGLSAASCSSTNTHALRWASAALGATLQLNILIEICC